MAVSQAALVKLFSKIDTDVTVSRITVSQAAQMPTSKMFTHYLVAEGRNTLKLR